MSWVVGESVGKSKAQGTRDRSSNRSSRSNRSKCWARIYDQELTTRDRRAPGVFFSQYDGSLPWEKKWPINDFNKFLGPESHDVNGFLSAINEEYFYE
jgi:hypothetical protein